MIINWLLLPFFLLDVNRTKKGSSFIGFTVLSFDNHMMGYSCAEIEAVLWGYGIPTHLLDVKTNKASISDSFAVPSNRAFFADVILRQNATKLGYTVTSPVCYQGGKPSTSYQSKQYKRWGIESKQKGVLSQFQHMIFGSLITYKHVQDLPKRGRDSENNQNCSRYGMQRVATNTDRKGGRRGQDGSSIPANPQRKGAKRSKGDAWKTWFDL